MSETQDDWLALREPHDHASRSAELTNRFVSRLDADTLLVDLGCGTGSNYRYLNPKLSAGQRWLCIDNEQEVLERASRMVPAASGMFERHDLACALSSIALGPGTAITASAFLDMVSAAWIDQLVAQCRNAPLLMAMTFNGQLDWSPAEAEDEAIRREILAHQQTDQGFGPALGPAAASYLAKQLAARGYQVTLAASDWQLESSDRKLLKAMLGGIARRVRAQSTGIAIEAWLAARERQLEKGELHLTAGHNDLLAVPS
jgi:hypothetical protein